MEPMLLKPVGKDYLWGGSRLKTEYGKESSLVPLAETWECSTHPDGPSMVVNGQFAGLTLSRVLYMHPEYLGKKAGAENTAEQPSGAENTAEQLSGAENTAEQPSGAENAAEQPSGAVNGAKPRSGAESGLPILVKFIDADKDLSVQVHPDDEYARIHEDQNGKTEMWYVLDARPGASLICGFAHDVTKEQLADALACGELAKQLQKVDVHKGDVFFIPAGTIHAIGAGVLIAEIQESSNVTYRVYDYDRIDKNGEKRQLHFEKAMEVLNMKSGVDVRQKPRIVRYYPGCSRELLCRCRYFDTERVQFSTGFSFSVLEQSFQVLLCLEGEGRIETDEMSRPLLFSKGDCMFLPAALGRCHIFGKAELLKIRC